MSEICNECGKSVAPGSGRFVNRVISLDDKFYRKAMGKPFPDGDYTCGECDTSKSEMAERLGITEEEAGQIKTKKDCLEKCPRCGEEKKIEHCGSEPRSDGTIENRMTCGNCGHDFMDVFEVIYTHTEWREE